MNSRTNSDIVRTYLRTIGKGRALEMTGQQIHDAIFDRCGEDIAISTVHQIRYEYTVVKKQRGNVNGNFNRPFKKPRT